jgi:protease-4
MRRNLILLLVVFLINTACSTHIHLDFLGKEQMEEVTLVKSKAKEKILLLDIDGIISTSERPQLFRKEKNIISRIYSRLEKASQDPAVKGVILRLDTPGGEVTTSDILHNEILNFKKKTGMPVVSLMMGVAASGGYYIASASDYLIAHPSTITGSIGVISIFPNLEDLLSKIGIKVNIIKSGQMKDSGSTFRDLSKEEKKMFQAIIDSFHQKFLQVVYTSRKESIPLGDLEKIADGRIYTASQALKLKLIDEIGYFDTALKKTLSLARINQAKIISYTYFPGTKTNIYASKLNDIVRLDSDNIQKILQSLQSGFYYLWIPQLSN